MLLILLANLISESRQVTIVVAGDTILLATYGMQFGKETDHRKAPSRTR
jgi:hypothetical protein